MKSKHKMSLVPFLLITVLLFSVTLIFRSNAQPRLDQTTEFTDALLTEATESTLSLSVTPTYTSLPTETTYGLDTTPPTLALTATQQPPVVLSTPPMDVTASTSAVTMEPPLTLTMSATIAVTQTPVPTLDSTEILSPTETGTLPTLTLTVTEGTANPPLETPTASLTPELLPTDIIIREEFNHRIAPQWVDPYLPLVPSGAGYMLSVQNSTDYFGLGVGGVADINIEGRFIIQQGEVFIGARHSGAGWYSVGLQPNGTITLYRGETLLGVISTGTVLSDNWHNIRLSITGDVIKAFIDGAEVISANDETSLPAGTVFLAALNGTFLADDIVVSTVNEYYNSTPTPPPTLSVEEAQYDQVESIFLPPDTTRYPIVYEAGTAFSYSIWLTDQAGANHFGVTGDLGGSQQMPASSPDGMRIAFSSNHEGNYEIYVLYLQSGQLQRLTYDLALDSDPTWSPDGTQIMYRSLRGGGLSNIYLINSTSGILLSTITTSTNSNIQFLEPSWTSIAAPPVFTRLDGNLDRTELWQYDLTNPYGNYVQPFLIPGVGNGYYSFDCAAWSPDGASIAFNFRASSSSPQRIGIATRSGAITTTYPPANGTNGDDRCPTWSPNHDYLLFQSDFTSPTQSELIRVNVSGNFSFTPITTSGINEKRPDWRRNIVQPVVLWSPINLVVTNPPTFSWQRLPEATWYYLWISGSSGTVLNQWYDVSLINCTGTACTVTPSLSLESGLYRWWVQAYSPVHGYHPWSIEGYFCGAPCTATVIAPTGVIANNQPQFEWNGVSGATWYYLWISGPSGHVLDQWFDASGICTSNMCRVIPSLNLESGLYRWWVQAYSPGFGHHPWSLEGNFAIRPGDVTIIAPYGRSTNNQPVFQWIETPGASWYYISIYNETGQFYSQSYSRSNCLNSICSVLTGLTFPEGNYRWWILAWVDGGGYGDWSAEIRFRVAPPICPAAIYDSFVDGIIPIPNCDTAGTGLRGDYYNGRNFGTLAHAVTQEQVNFIWGTTSPHSNVQPDDFAVVWSGAIQINASETYEFCIDSDDGVRLWVNYTIVIDSWQDQAFTRRCGDIELDGEQQEYFEIHLEYYENTGDAAVRLLWDEPYGADVVEPIPVNRLYPANEPGIVIGMLPPPAVPGTAVYPVDTGRLRTIAILNPSMIWGTQTPPPQNSVEWNRDVGIWFQDLVINASQGGIVPNNLNFSTPLRAARGSGSNQGRPSTRPDGFSDITILSPIQMISPQSNVVEIKARRGTLSPSYERYQFIGMFDIAVNSVPLSTTRPAIWPPVGLLSLISTSDTVVGSSLRTEATTFNNGSTVGTVGICQYYVWEIFGSQGPSNPGQSYFFIAGWPVPINTTPGFTFICVPYAINPVRGVPIYRTLDPNDPDPNDVGIGLAE